MTGFTSGVKKRKNYYHWKRKNKKTRLDASGEVNGGTERTLTDQVDWATTDAASFSAWFKAG